MNTDPAVIILQPLQEGLLSISVLETMLIVELVEMNGGEERLLDQWITPPLSRDEEQLEIHSIRWSDQTLKDFSINSQKVPRHVDCDIFRIEPLQPGNMSLLEPNIPQESRHSALRRSPGSGSLSMRQLADVVERLEALRTSWKSGGSRSFVQDASVLLRTLYCGHAKNGGQLVMRCANEVEIDLVCYTLPPLDLDATGAPSPDIAVYSSFSAQQNAILSKPVSLGEWLDSEAIKVGDRKLKNWEVIYGVGGKVGAHADAEMDWLETFDESFATSVNLSSLSGLFKSYVLLAMSHGRQVLAKRAWDAGKRNA